MVAAAAPPPIRLDITHVTTTGHGITALAFEATNTAGTPLTPHFALSKSQSASAPWTVRSGPAVLRPHQSARYVLHPRDGLYELPDARHHLRLRLRVFTDAPMTISSTDVALPRPAPQRPAGKGNAAGPPGRKAFADVRAVQATAGDCHAVAPLVRDNRRDLVLGGGDRVVHRVVLGEAGEPGLRLGREFAHRGANRTMDGARRGRADSP